MPKSFEIVAKDRVIVLPDDVSASAHCVVTVLDDGLETLHEQAQMRISDTKQQRMSELLDKNRDSTLTEAEQRELDGLAEEFDRATLTKGRAMAVLGQIRANASGAPDR